MDPIVSYRVKLANLTLTVLFHNPSSYPGAGTVFHKHYYTELFFCCSGSFSVMTGNREITISAGEMTTVPPDCLHHTALRGPDGKAEVFGLLAEPVEGAGEPDLFGIVAPILTENVLRVYRSAEPYLTVLKACMTSPGNPRNVLAVSRFLDALLTLPCSSCPVTHPQTAGAIPEKENLRLVRLHELINREYKTDLTLRRAAAELYLSERQLERFVRKHYGKSLWQVVLSKRMEAAAVCLVNTNDPVGKIGQQVGFGSHPVFSRHFRARFGVTPAEYRRRARSRGKEQGA